MFNVKSPVDGIPIEAFWLFQAVFAGAAATIVAGAAFPEDQAQSRWAGFSAGFAWRSWQIDLECLYGVVRRAGSSPHPPS
jgi:hypothetical protein